MITALSRASMLALRAGWVAALCLLGASVGVEAQTQLAVRGVSVVDVVTGQTLPNQTILIEGDRIVAVGPSGGVEIPAGVETLDGTGLFAAPGLVDLHVHMEPDDLPLFLANGVTTVREMNGSAETLTLRAEVRSGVRPGPTIYTTGPLLAGVEQQWRHQLLSSVAAAESQVRTDHAAGYDFIKVYDGLDEPTYRALVETAAELDVPVLGHVPAAVGLDRVLEDGLLSIEHVEQLARATVGHDPDLTTIPETVAKLARGGTAVTPTLAAMEILSARRTAWFDALYERDEMRFAPESVAGWWSSLRQPESRRATLAGGPDGGDGDWVRFYRELTRALDAAGVPLLVGTDTPNPMLVPGYSVHHELEALVRAGLDPARVLRAATQDAADHLGLGGEVGAIEPGRRADLVLLRGDPLEDLRHLRDPHGLVLRGVWWTGEDLEELTRPVASRRAP